MLKTWVALTTQVPGSGQGLGRPIVDQENRPFASLWQANIATEKSPLVELIYS